MDRYLSDKISLGFLNESGIEDVASLSRTTSKGIDYLHALPKKETEGFDYLTHYRIDHEKFDYTIQSPCTAQVEDERRVHERILALISDSGNEILDVGCGGGWMAKAMHNTSNTLTSMDLSEINVEKVLDKYPSDKHHGIAADSINHPFRENSFDIIVASEVIEHVERPTLFLSSLARTLKPNGSIIITTPYKENIIKETCIHCNGITPRNAHLHSFDEHILTSIAPSGTKATYQIFGNKALMMARAYKIFGKLGLKPYSAIDTLANKIIKKPAHILVKYKRA
ncbi:MAG: hypothetical protein Kapaf2KO_01110 [Candidatus Kapaibacteriales bacterium]